MNHLIKTFLIVAALSVSTTLNAQSYGNYAAGSSPTVRERPVFMLKTNVALLGAGVANIGGEVLLRCNMTLDLPLIYSPYTIHRNWKLRALIVQPEYRIWLNRAPRGHFFGAHAHAGYFNVAVDDQTRYQDRNGDTPLWGFGLSYGYAVALSRRWGLEFTIGAGYAKITYDSFYNIPNGAKFDTATHNFWGITRVGISLHYIFFNRR